jgi:hypothetical protein
MIAVLRTLVEGIRQEKRGALTELRRRLESRGYDISQRPDTNHKSYRLGAEVCVLLSGSENEVIKSQIVEIEHITRQVASQFGFTPITAEPIRNSSHTTLAYCGFLK